MFLRLSQIYEFAKSDLNSRNMKKGEEVRLNNVRLNNDSWLLENYKRVNKLCFKTYYRPRLANKCFKCVSPYDRRLYKSCE